MGLFSPMNLLLCCHAFWADLQDKPALLLICCLQAFGNPKWRGSLSHSTSGAIPAVEQALRTILPKSGSSCAAGAGRGPTCRHPCAPSSAPGWAVAVGCCVKQVGTWLPRLSLPSSRAALLSLLGKHVPGLSPLPPINTISSKPNSATFTRFS